MSSRLELAIARFDQVNGADPSTEPYQGGDHPSQWVYGRRMSEWLNRIEPQAGEALQLAARSQHIRRWEIPRERYPMDRQGYLRWRQDLGRFHADTAATLLAEVGYDAETIDRVRDLLQKKNLKSDPDAQTLEDVICLVFLESYFADFSTKHDRDKIVHIIRRTWKKMSPRGREIAWGLELAPAQRQLVADAIGQE